ncbi:MAG: hypothetical protein H0V41_04240 [Pseudonocardiales bacterium]|nr:hypothetical protein [Pseudonocardiales bacterium]
MHAVLPNARDGFEVFDLQTGTVLTSRHADRQFAAMSVVKLLIALDALARNNWVTPDGDTLITPQDMVTGYRYLTDQVPGPDRDLLLGALADAPRIASDGFKQYFGIPDGLPHTTWAIKQGWGTSGSQAVMESTGLVGSDLRQLQPRGRSVSHVIHLTP